MTNTTTSEFAEFISDRNLRLAWNRLTRSMHRAVKDWLGLQAYFPQLGAHIQILQKTLKAQYEPSDASPFYRTKRDRSLRMFSFLTMDDRLVYQALCNVLIKKSYCEVTELAHARQLFANIPTLPQDGSPFVFKRVFGNRFTTSEGQYDRFRGQILRSKSEFLEKHNDPWLVRTDVRSYFPSLDHRRLCKLLKCRNWLSDDRTIQVLMDCLKKWEVERGKGIPIGYECSDHIGNIFLIPLDEALADFTVHRYVDDIYIYVEDFERAKQAIHIVDEVLGGLSLQRNTGKTEFLNLQEVTDDNLKERLTESLSQLAEEKQTEVSEEERQRNLLDLLHNEFGTHFENLNLRQGVKNISTVAFVLYRLRKQDENVRRLAFYVLDHYPNYAFHAMTYLFRVYRNDLMFASKLAHMFEAEYEAQDVKANALRFLKLIDNGTSFNGLFEDLLESPDTDDWHLTYLALRETIDTNASSRHADLLDTIVNNRNPFLSSYAAVTVFAKADSEHRVELVDTLVRKDSDYARKIGLYLAHRYRITPSAVPSHLEGLMEAEWLEEKDYFHKAIEELFDIVLPDGFLVTQYFGEFDEVNQLLRDIQGSLSAGINVFLNASRALLHVFFSQRQVGANASSAPEVLDFPDDDDLTSLLNDLELDSAGAHKWKNGKQTYLLDRLRLIMRKYLQNIEGIRSVTQRDEVFICYARKNSEWKERVETHLKPFENYFNITVWSDENITKGGDWDAEIKAALQRAKVAILLETPDFLASNYIHNDELPEIMRAAEDEGLVIMRFPISSSSVDITPLARINAVWDTGSTLQALQDAGQIDKVDRILASACKQVTCVVSDSFREIHCMDDD